MIRETLQAIRGAQSVPDMAKQLGVDQEDLRQRLRILEDSGYIERPETSCDCSPVACMGCHCCGSMPLQNSTYVLTEKGKKVLDRA